jgi:hypothetical protein
VLTRGGADGRKGLLTVGQSAPNPGPKPVKAVGGDCATIAAMIPHARSSS